MKSGFLILSFLLLFIIQPSKAFDAGQSVELDSLLSVLVNNNKLFGSLTLKQGDKIIYSKGFGYSFLAYKNDKKEKKLISEYKNLYQNNAGQTKVNSDNEVSDKSGISNAIINSDKDIFSQINNRNTKLRLGSITKMFTAVMIFQLIEEGKLTLDTPLSKFFPQLPNSKKIKISHLLSHHSGLFNFTSDTNFPKYRSKPKSHKEILDIMKNQKPVFEPGTKGEYCNTNYVLLGYIVEKITGKSFKDEVKERIADKIELKNTYVGSEIKLSEHESFPYLYIGNHWERGPETDLSILQGCGAVVSNSMDLIRFIDAIFNCKLVSFQSLNSMMTQNDGFGMGILTYQFVGKKIWGHTGGIDGFFSIAGEIPEDSLTIAFCTNARNYNPNEVIAGILSIVYNKPYEIPQFRIINLSDEQLSNYTGVYSSPKLTLRITIRKKNGWLYAQADNMEEFPLEALSETEFKLDAISALIIFSEPKNGVYKEFKLIHGETEFNFTKK